MVDLIERSDADCRIDKRDFEGGGDIGEQINSALGESQEIVILFTPNSKGADWVSFENPELLMIQFHGGGCVVSGGADWGMIGACACEMVGLVVVA